VSEAPPTIETLGEARQEFHRHLWYLSVATVLLFVALAAVVYWGVTSSQKDRRELRKEEVRTTSALCSLRRDLEGRIASTQDFLNKHPHGIPGIPVATIRTSLNNQRATVKSLDILACPSPLKTK
jgi:hypothetical protein